MKGWLRDALANAGTDIREAYLFGSVLDPSRPPRDIDLLVVTADGAGRSAWCRVRHWRKNVENQFKHQFGLPLSVLLATPSEWRELDGTIVRKREREALL